MDIEIARFLMLFTTPYIIRLIRADLLININYLEQGFSSTEG